MQAVINIELDDKVPGLDIAGRYEFALAAVRKYFTRSVAEISLVEYKGPHGEAQEITAVVVVEFHSSGVVANMAFDFIARECQQDCIAVLFGDGRGELVGPNAKSWGDFNIEYFKAPSIAKLFKEAA